MSRLKDLLLGRLARNKLLICDSSSQINRPIITPVLFATLILLSGATLFPLTSISPASAAVTANTVQNAVGTWTEQTDYGASSGKNGTGGIPVLGDSCVVNGQFIYCVGGQIPSNGTDVSDVFYNHILSDGSLGPWVETTDYGATSGKSGSGGIGTEFPSCVASGGYIYCVAGATKSGIVSSVFYAKLSSAGVGPWTETTDYGAVSGSTGTGGFPNFQLSCVAYKGYIYCVGGGPQVFYAHLSSSGVGPWVETTDYGSASTSNKVGAGGTFTRAQSCALSGNAVYCVGGENSTYVTQSTVFTASLNSSGVGAWKKAAPYGSNGTSAAIPIFDTSCVSPAGSGNIMCVGGETPAHASLISRASNSLTPSMGTNAVFDILNRVLKVWESLPDHPTESVPTTNYVCNTFVTLTNVIDVACGGSGNAAWFEIQLHKTSTTIVCDPNPVAAGSRTTCTATVKDTSSNPTTPTREVFATFGDRPDCVLAPVSLGTSSCTLFLYPKTAGAFEVGALYTGDDFHLRSEGTTTLQVT